MRKLTEDDLSNIVGTIVEGYEVESVRVKRGSFSDSNHYGYILGRSEKGYYVCWQFHLDENEEPNVYWGNYFMENREGALRDFETRDLDIDKPTVWKMYLRYLRDWVDSHKESGFYGATPVCFDEWFDNEYREEEINAGTDSTGSYTVTITETLQQTVTVTASNQHEAEEMVQEEWNNQDHILDADNFVGVEFTASPANREEMNSDA